MTTEQDQDPHEVTAATTPSAVKPEIRINGFIANRIIVAFKVVS
jgi:hypothetical protein